MPLGLNTPRLASPHNNPKCSKLRHVIPSYTAFHNITAHNMRMQHTTVRYRRNPFQHITASHANHKTLRYGMYSTLQYGTIQQTPTHAVQQDTTHAYTRSCIGHTWSACVIPCIFSRIATARNSARLATQHCELVIPCIYSLQLLCCDIAVEKLPRVDEHAMQSVSACVRNPHIHLHRYKRLCASLHPHTHLRIPIYTRMYMFIYRIHIYIYKHTQIKPQ